MELTKQDIQKIDKYLEKGIPFWDLRLEMIDHLASKLERSEIVELNDTFFKQEFGTPWDLSHKKLRSLRVQISKKYRKLVRKEFVAFFKELKNIGLLFVFLIIEYFLFSIYKTKTILAVNLIVFGILFLSLYFISIKKAYKIKKSFSLNKLQYSILFPIFIFQLPNIINTFKTPISYQTTILVMIFLLISSFIWTISTFKVFLKMVAKHKKVFNQYNALKG